MKHFETFTFLTHPRIFFSHVLYRGPLLGCQISTLLESTTFTFGYKAIIGTLYGKKTQNINSAILYRTIPKMISNTFSLSAAYKLKENLILGGKAVYGNSHNHTIGTSKTYDNGVLLVDVKNILSCMLKNLRLLVSLEYEF